ncbi:class I SAM-dependent methyltransferase [Microlunatus speluncae]|uniref:class I SAM-dependent methyltransferase n=1 Tax=Microlunatus speluncae TaxID=2594267 RepID=UPI0013756651|nr:class I SAM-dependent methyltransferase [Microlunatus speluncae]
MVTYDWKDGADAYARSFAHLCAGTVDEILRRIGPGDSARRLLDIGTGPGTVAAAARDNGYTVIGLDSDPSMIALASRSHPGISFGLASIRSLPCRDQILDVVTANFVVNHTPDPRSAVRELFRALRCGGRLIATIWTSQPGPLNQLWNQVMTRAAVTPPAGSRLPPEHDFERTAEGFGGILAEAGFEQVECQELHWTFEIRPDDLWSAVEAGIAGIGQTFRSQDAAGQERMRAAYGEITATVVGDLKLRSVALIASADRVR